MQALLMISSTMAYYSETGGKFTLHKYAIKAYSCQRQAFCIRWKQYNCWVKLRGREMHRCTAGKNLFYDSEISRFRQLFWHDFVVNFATCIQVYTCFAYTLYYDISSSRVKCVSCFVSWCSLMYGVWNIDPAWMLCGKWTKSRLNWMKSEQWWLLS